MRGTRPLIRSLLLRLGIIPADAGNTEPIGTNQNGARDHPRGCGEHCKETAIQYMPTGSSPRMRGTHTDGPSGSGRHGIIPADAGNTLKNPCNPNNMIDKISDF